MWTGHIQSSDFASLPVNVSATCGTLQCEVDIANLHCENCERTSMSLPRRHFEGDAESKHDFSEDVISLAALKIGVICMMLQIRDALLIKTLGTKYGDQTHLHDPQFPPL